MTAKTISLLSKYGVTEQKKSELDRLLIETLDAQSEVEQLQAIVTALSEKSSKFTAFLNTADANRTQALSNQNLLDDVLQNALDLLNNSEVALEEAGLAEVGVKQVAVEIKDVMDKLIYSAEVINRLGILVVRKKAVNPLISDELVSMITKAGTDANNAVALTLVALKSTFASQASGGEAEAAVTLEYTQAKALFFTISGQSEIDGPKVNTNANIEDMLENAYNISKTNYLLAQEANNDASSQLKNATAKLKKAQIKLKSLQSGYAAATAAALAS